MIKCGLLGRRLGHSYSPRIHNLLGNYAYELFEKEPEELETFLKDGDWTGINVTVPYKKTVMPFLSDLTPVAEKLGAVNTVVRRNGKLIGHNTDYSGFYTMVRESKLAVKGKKTLILGSGGASNTAAAVMRELGAEVVIISRTGQDNYSNLSNHADAAVIVNTTPVGMYPDTDASPVDLSLFSQLEGVLDVIYNPARTELLQQAEEKGIIAMNGLLMLVAQAKEASEWFQGKEIPDSVIHSVSTALARDTENIILIGMPGCGKSTVGKTLAHCTGREFADSDELIVRLAGKSIPEIFQQDGEEAFRCWETTAISKLGKESGLVIATGGGCVTQMRNYPLLHQNGSIFWLKRDLSQLATDGRPLSRSIDVKTMYTKRKPMYAFFGDYIVENNSDPEITARKILQILEERL